jgi:hypothetical protein
VEEINILSSKQLARADLVQRPIYDWRQDSQQGTGSGTGVEVYRVWGRACELGVRLSCNCPLGDNERLEFQRMVLCSPSTGACGPSMLHLLRSTVGSWHRWP